MLKTPKFFYSIKVEMMSGIKKAKAFMSSAQKLEYILY